MARPCLINGQISLDGRGAVFHNNSFDLSKIKRIYKIKNKNTDLNRGWKGHKIEKRWFMATKGEISIQVIPINDIELKIYDNVIEFSLSCKNMNVLYVPDGYATNIKQKLEDSEVLVFADYYINQSCDEGYRWNF